jgi:hypothetical protein
MALLGLSFGFAWNGKCSMVAPCSFELALRALYPGTGFTNGDSRVFLYLGQPF